jgi:hypothetical protein
MSDQDWKLWATACELAKSGNYPNASYIEMELTSQGYKNVHEISDDAWARQRLTSMCFEARKGKPNA